MFVLAPDHLWYLSLQPRSPGEIDVRYGLAFAPEVMADGEVLDARLEEARTFLDATNEEDRVVVETLWEGVQAPLAQPGPLSWLEKENLDFLRYIVRMVKGLSNSYHVPVFGMEIQGSQGSSAAPFCSSSMEMPSGERTNAILPSRGGRLMVTPFSASLAHVAWMSSTS